MVEQYGWCDMACSVYMFFLPLQHIPMVCIALLFQTPAPLKAPIHLTSHWNTWLPYVYHWSFVTAKKKKAQNKISKQYSQLFSFLCTVLYNFVLSFCPISFQPLYLSVLWFTASDYWFSIFKLFFFFLSLITMYLVGGFFRVLWFLPPIKILTATI